MKNLDSVLVYCVAKNILKKQNKGKTSFAIRGGLNSHTQYDYWEVRFVIQLHFAACTPKAHSTFIHCMHYSVEQSDANFMFDS